MKTLATILFAAVFTLLVLLYFANRQNQDNARRDRKTLLKDAEQWKERALKAEHEKDSAATLALSLIYKSKFQDSIINASNARAKELEGQVNTFRRREVKFMRTNTDAERDSTLKELYPSLK
jgi:hypothetical protein